MLLISKTDLDDAERLYVWRTEYLDLHQLDLGIQYGFSQNAISKMEVGYEDRAGIPVHPDLLRAIKADWRKVVFTVSSQAAILRRREQFSKNEVAAQLGVGKGVVGEMENSRHPRPVSKEYEEWLTM